MKSMHAITPAAFTIAGVIQYGNNLLGIVLASARAIRLGWRFIDSTPAAQALSHTEHSAAEQAG
jgi:hypothetical protein